MRYRWLLLAGLVAAQEDATCSAKDHDAGICGLQQQLDDSLEAELDGVAQDIEQNCPLYNSGFTSATLWALGILKRLTGTMSMLSLWPAGVHPENFADEYTASVMTIIGRVLLGLYKTRDKSYVNVPSEMLDTRDLLKVEHIHAPHYDVDGSPNFYWFEGAVPQLVMRKLYVPLMTCFYSALRKLNVANNSLTGGFEDGLADPFHNTWPAVLKENQSMRDWVMSFYDIAHTWDGKGLWPEQMTDFSVYFKKDEWEDRLEYAIGFHLIGAHRLEKGSWKFKTASGEAVLPFRIALNSLSAFAVREHFGKYGVDLYFTEDGLPALLETPDGAVVVRGDKEWQYWKFVWRSTLVTGVTLTDHLHFTHFRSGGLMSRAVRVALPPTHALRRVFSIFTFGTIFVNVQAVHVLCGPNHLLHRATPFKDFVKLSHKVPELLKDITEAKFIRVISEEQEWAKLDPKLKTLPYYSDGRLLFGAIKQFVEELVKIIKFCDGDKVGTDFDLLRKEFLNETLEAHYHLDDRVQPLLKELNSGKCGSVLPYMKQRIAIMIFIVTGFHRHVGFVGDYYADPSLATMSWKSGEAFGRPRQHMIMSVVNVFTSMRQPLLKEDYTHLFKGIEEEEALVKAWKNFQQGLREVEEEIDRRNEKREIRNLHMSPKVVESAVSK